LPSTSEFRNRLEQLGQTLIPLSHLDCARMHAHSVLCQEVDKIETIPSVAQMEQQFQTPGIEIEGHLYGIEAADSSRLIAIVATVPMPGTDAYYCNVNVTVDPDFRTDGLEALLLDFAVANAQEWAANRGVKVLIQAGCRDDQAHYVQLYTNAGFHAVRYFHAMERNLVDLPIENPELPEGYTVIGQVKM
jgi:GNAT superfamily N-acetyltransferase